MHDNKADINVTSSYKKLDKFQNYFKNSFTYFLWGRMEGGGRNRERELSSMCSLFKYLQPDSWKPYWSPMG